MEFNESFVRRSNRGKVESMGRVGNGRGHRLAIADRPTGIADVRQLPDQEFVDLWNAILVGGDEKDRLLSQAILNFTMRPKVSRAVLPLHGIILLVGPPGTGKTSLAKGLAARVAEVLKGSDFTFVEVDPHALSSSNLGKSQRAVTNLFEQTLKEYATAGPTIVLLDEVETLVVDRSRLSLDANPIDVHRATDAALVQLDRIAASHPEVLFVATSNFARAIDAAFVSRADLVLTVPLPDENGRLSILRDTLSRMASQFPAIGKLAASPNLASVARAAKGLDGRALRKLVVSACALDKAAALDPNKVTLDMLKTAAKYASDEAAALGESK